MTIQKEFLSSSILSAYSSLHELAQIALDSTEQTLQLNLKAARGYLEASQGQDLDGFQDWGRFQSSLTESLLTSGSQYASSLYGIAAKTREALGHLGENHRAGLSKSVGHLLEKAEKSAPAGAELGIVAVRSALSAANSAFDTWNQAGQRAAAFTEAQVAAVSGATAKAVPAVAAKGKAA